MRIHIDPNVESHFRVLEPGTYNVSITAVVPAEGPKAKYLKVTMVVTEPEDLTGIQVFDNLMYESKAEVEPENFQGNLKSLVEAALGEWKEFDHEELVGQNVQLRTKHEEYEGELQHRVRRFGYAPYGPLPEATE